jgi:site-specific DNA recombinase
MKTIILARVSDEEQDSNEAQIMRIVDYAEKKGLTIWKKYEIKESSTRGDRKKFQQVIKDIENSKEPVALAVDTVDRLQRSFRESVILDDLRKAGKVEIHFYRESLVINKDSNSADLIRWDVAVMFARSYVLQLSDNVKRKIEYKIKHGEWIGKAPIGYINVCDENDKERKDIIPDPTRAHFIVKIFEMYSTGKSIRIIQKEMEKLGLRGTTKKNKPLSCSMVYSVLRNPFYFGLMRIKKGKLKGLYPHKYQPLISKSLFDKCQQVMLDYHKKPFKYAGKPFVLRGMVKCAGCGCTITPETAKGHIYYSCTNYKGFHKKRTYIREEVLMKPIYEVLQNIKLPDEKIKEITEDLKKSNEAKNEFHKQSVEALRKEYDRIENRISRLFDLRLDDSSITKDMFNKKLKEYKEKQAELNEQIQRYTDADENYYITANTVFSLAKRAYELFKASEVSEKRQLLNFLLQNPKLQGKKLQFELKTPFDRVLQANKCSNMLRGPDSNRQHNA